MDEVRSMTPISSTDKLLVAALDLERQGNSTFSVEDRFAEIEAVLAQAAKAISGHGFRVRRRDGSAVKKG